MRSSRYAVMLILALGCLRCFAEDSFYQRFLTVVPTNETSPWLTDTTGLIDTNNTAPKLTNVSIKLDILLTNGVFGDIRLGMTMDEVVERWGKPMYMHARCGGGPRMRYKDVMLNFKENGLDYFDVPTSTRFDHGLRGSSKMEEWIRVLGKPTLRRETNSRITIAYETRGTIRTVLLLTFETDGEMEWAPRFYRDPDITKWFQPAKP